MGGGLVINFILANPDLHLAGLILNSPFYRFPQNVRMSFFKLKMLEILSQNLPEIMMSTKISMNSITKDIEVIASYEKDILLLSALTLRLVKALVDITIPLKKKNLL